MCRCDNSSFDCHFKVAEIMVNTNSVRHMLLDVVCHAVTCDPFIAIRRGNIIRQLNLKEVTGTTFAIPLDLVLQRMLSRESKHRHIVTIDDQTVITRVVPRENQTLCCMIGTPQPNIVTNGVAVVNLKHNTSLHTTCCLITHTNENILQHARV